MRSALQQEHDLEGPTRGNEASAAAAALLGMTEHASAAAGTRFGTTGGAEMWPALQREQHIEGPNMEIFLDWEKRDTGLVSWGLT